MTVRIFTALLTVAVLAGCTSVRSVDVNGGTAAYSDVNRGVKGKVTRVLLRDGTKMDVVGVRVDDESLSWMNRGANTLESVPRRDVRQVSVVKAGYGAFRGLLVGVIAGAAIGGVRAAVEGDDPDLGTDPLAVTQEEKFRIYPVAHAVYAALAATPVGAILGTRRVYLFEPDGVVVER